MLCQYTVEHQVQIKDAGEISPEEGEGNKHLGAWICDREEVQRILIGTRGEGRADFEALCSFLFGFCL